jgi:SAM-dependent methyltransferase
VSVSSRIQQVSASQVRVDDEGILVRSRSELVLDVLFDGRRIWSFWLHRDGEPSGDAHLVPWPGTLREFLHGTTRLTLTVHATSEVIFDEEVTLSVGHPRAERPDAPGAAGGRIAVVNHEGRPLALDKSLRRVQTFDTRTAEHVAPLMRAIDDVLGALKVAGVEPFLAYGTLLGAVRNGRLIGHDSDADLGYVSVHEHPVDVMRESFRLQRELQRLGYPVTRYSGAAFKVDVRESDGSVRGLDVFGGFMLDGRLHLMGEIRTPFRRDWVTPLGSATLEGFEFPVPANTDKFLTATYGPHWRVPDPAFHFETPDSTHRRLNGWFRGIRMQRALWDRAYAGKLRAGGSYSPLARFVAAQEPEIGHFVDLGCGTGQDVAFMAGRGVTSTGLDFQPRGFEPMARRAAAEGLPAEFLTMNLLELRSFLSVSALMARMPAPRIVAARHLVDAIGPKARANLWRSAEMMTRGGGRLYLEFLAKAGDDGYARRHRVKPRNPERMAREIRASGGTVLLRNQRKAAAPSGAVPAKICRMVVTWESSGT